MIRKKCGSFANTQHGSNSTMQVVPHVFLQSKTILFHNIPNFFYTFSPWLLVIRKWSNVDLLFWKSPLLLQFLRTRRTSLCDYDRDSLYILIMECWKCNSRSVPYFNRTSTSSLMNHVAKCFIYAPQAYMRRLAHRKEPHSIFLLSAQVAMIADFLHHHVLKKLILKYLTFRILCHKIWLVSKRVRLFLNLNENSCSWKEGFRKYILLYMDFRSISV